MTNDKPKHDQIFRKALENPIAASEFITAHLPNELLQIVDIASLKLEKESFVEPTLTNSFSDVLFSVKFNDRDGYIYVLLEHQSTVDRFMAFRLNRYKINIQNLYLTKDPKPQYLPLVCPIVVYNGTEKYNAPLNIWDLHSEPILARKLWTEDYTFINVHEIPDEEFRKRAWSGILEFFMKHIHERNLLKRWQQIADLLPKIVKVSIGADYIKLFLQYTLTAIDKDDKIALDKLLTNTLTKQKREEIMGSIAQQLKEEGIQEGIQEGIEIGKAELIKTMLESGMDIYLVSKHLRISVKEIEKMISEQE